MFIGHQCGHLEVSCPNEAPVKKSQGEREEVFIGARRVGGIKDTMIIRTFDLKNVPERLVVETIGFSDLCWRVNQRFRAM